MKIRWFMTLFLLASLAFCFSTAEAKADLGFKGIGVRVGYVMPEDPIDNTFGFGAQVKLGTIIPELALDAFVDYFSKSYDTGVGGDASISDIGVGAQVKYFFATKSNIKPYAGGGLALQFVGSKVDTPYGDASDTQTDIGFHLVGGAEMPLSAQLNGVAEVKYVASDLNYFGIFAGVIYRLGK